MADVIIRIRALDLTGPAVRSAKENLNRLTTQTRVDAASKNISEAFKNLVRGVDIYTKQSAAALAVDVQRRKRAIQTIEAMETRLRLHIKKETSETERHRQQERLRTITAYKQHLNSELSNLKSVLKNKDAAEVASHKTALMRMKERAREDTRIRKTALDAAKAFNKQIEAEEKKSAERRENVASRMKAFRTTVGKSAKAIGFESLFAGVTLGSQAGMLGSSLGGAMGGLGSELSGGITSLANIVPKTIAIITKAVSLGIRGVGTVLSLATAGLTAALGIVTVGIPEIGMLVAGVVTGLGSAIAGVMRGLTDMAAGAIQLVGGAIEGIAKTAQELIGTVMGTISSLIGGIVGAVSSVIGKALGMLGDAFNGLLSIATSTFEQMLQKNIEFGRNMADVFTQIPEYGIAGFKKLEQGVNNIFKKLPLGRQDISKGLFEIVSTKLTKSPDEALKVLEGVSKAAVAGGSESTVLDTAKAATAVLSAFRMEASSTEAVLSKMFKASAEGRFSFADLAEGIQNVSGIAANFGENLDDLLASYVLASQSMARQTTPIGIKNLILSLASPTREAQKHLNKLGISFKDYTQEELDSMAAGRKLITQLEAQIKAFEKMEKKTHNQKMALKEMKDALKAAREDMTDLEHASGKFIGVIPSVKRIAERKLSPAQERELVPERRALAALEAIKSELDKADETLGEISADTGQQMAKAVDIQMDTMDNRLKLMANTFESLFTDPFKFLEPSFKRAISGIVDRLPKLRDVISKQLTFDQAAAQAMMGEWVDGVINATFDAGEFVVNNWREIADQVVEAWKAVEVVFKAVSEIFKAGSMVMKDVFGIDSADAFAKAMKAAAEAADEVWKAINKISEGDLSPLMDAFGSLKVLWAELMDYMKSSIADMIMSVEGPINELMAQVSEKWLMATNPVDTYFAKHTPRQYASTYKAGKSVVESSLAGKGSGPETEIFNEMFKGWADRAGLAKTITSELQNKSGSIASVGNDLIGTGFRTGALAEAIATAMKKHGATWDTDKIVSALKVSIGANEEKLAKFLENLEGFAGAVEGLKAYGFKSEKGRDSAFSKAVDLGGVAADLSMPTAPKIREEVEVAKMARALEKALVPLIHLLIMDPTGTTIASAPKGPSTGGLHAKKASATKYHEETPQNEVIFDRPPQTAADKAAEKSKSLADSENIQETADNTDEMADTLKHMSLAPSVGDEESLVTGKVKTKPSNKGFKAATEAIAGAMAVAGERPPLKKGRAQRGDKFMDDDEARFNRSDLIKARNAWRRAQMRTANAPFGQMGISGPLGQVGGKPIIDPATGKIKGFTGGVKSNFGLGPTRVKKVVTTAERRAAYSTYKAKKIAEAEVRKATKAAKAKTFRDKHAPKPKMPKEPKKSKQEKLFEKIPMLESIFGKPEGFKGGPKEPEPSDLSLHKPPNPFEGTGKPLEEEGKAGDAAGAANAVAAKIQEATAKQSELNAALNALAQIQADAADGTVTLTAEQLTALTKVTEAVGNVAAAVVETQGKIPELMGKFTDDINKKIQELKDQAKKMEAALGL